MKVKKVYHCEIVADVDMFFCNQKTWNRIKKLWEFKNTSEESEYVFLSLNVALDELRQAENAGKHLNRPRVIEYYTFIPTL